MLAVKRTRYIHLLAAALLAPSVSQSAIVTSGDVTLQPAHDWVRVAAAGTNETGTLEVNGGSVLTSQGSPPVPLPATNILEPGGMVGRFDGSYGTATVTGAGSTWLLQGIGTDGPTPSTVDAVFGPFLLVGRDGGRGELNVNGGGKVILDGLGADIGANGSGNVKIGRDPAAGGSVLNIDGPGSEVLIHNIDHTQFRMGNVDASFVNITNQGKLTLEGNSITQIQWGDFNVNTGGRVSTNLAVVGNRQDSDATLNIDGPGSLVHLTGVGTADNEFGNNGYGGFLTVARGENSTAVVNVSNGAELRIDSGVGLASDGTPSAGSGFSIGGNNSSTSGQGTLNITSNALVTVSGGGEFVGIARSQTGTGIVNINSGGQMLVANNANSSGVLMAPNANSGTAELNIDGPTSQLDAGRVLMVGVLGGPTNTAQANVNLSNGGRVKAQNIVVASGGTLAGVGTVEGNLNTEGGTVAPGLSPGTMTVNGNYFLVDGVLEIEIAGTAPGQYDVLDVSGLAGLFGGTILFSFLDGFLPQADDPIIEFLHAGDGVVLDSGLNFEFKGVDDSFQFDVLEGTLGLGFDALTDARPLNPVPLPAAFWLFLSAMGLLGVIRKRGQPANLVHREPLAA